MRATSNPTASYVFDLGTGNPVHMKLDMPETRITPHELLPVIYSLADEIIRHSCETQTSINKPVQCNQGCSACCNQLVPVSEYEAAHLAAVVRAMPQAQRSRIVTRFSKAIENLELADLLTKITDIFAHEAHDWRQMLDLKKYYWKLAIPCPFLEDDSCSIHPHRPIACRQYLVTSPQSHCANIYSADEAHDVVIHPVDIGGALASFSGEGLQQSRILPLIFSLLAERGIRSQTPPALPADQMMGRFLDLLSTCFTRKD